MCIRHPCHMLMLLRRQHKTLRASRGGLIMTNDEALGKKFNSAVFPGLQGRPLMHAIKPGSCVWQALKPEFKAYIQTVVATLKFCRNPDRCGVALCLVVLIRMLFSGFAAKGLTGNITEVSLEHAGITCNKTAFRLIHKPPMVTSGVRLGTPASTTWFGNDEFVPLVMR